MITTIHKVSARSIGLALTPPTTELLAVASGKPFFCRYDRYWDCNDRDLAGDKNNALSAAQLFAKVRASGVHHIVLMYNEPFHDIPELKRILTLATDNNVRLFLNTFGITNMPAPLEKCTVIDGVVIQFPSLEDHFYRKMYSEGTSGEVKQTIEFWLSTTIPIQLNTVILPGENDKPHHITKMIDYVRTLSRPVFWQLERFYPQYKLLDKPPTDLTTMTQIASEIRASGITSVAIFDSGSTL